MPSIPAHVSYDSFSRTYNIQPGAKAADIQNLLNAATSGTTFHFLEGVHSFNAGLVVKNDGISLTGAGENKTTFLFQMSGSSYNGIQVEGAYKSWSGTLAGDAATDSKTITLQSVSGLKAGDILHIQQKNTDAFLDQNGYENIKGSSNAAKNPINETLVEIASISGNKVTLKTPITHNMDKDDTTVKLVDPVDNVHLSDFKMTYNLGTPDADAITNAKSQYEGAIAIYLNKTTDAEIKNVSVINPPSHSIEIRTALNPLVDNVHIDGAHNKGTGGNGYGLHIVETYYGTFNNLDIVNTRHAVAFSAWHTEVGNKVHVLETNRDINYHGGPDYNNVVVVDRDQVSVDRALDQCATIIGVANGRHALASLDALALATRLREVHVKR